MNFSLKKVFIPLFSWVFIIQPLIAQPVLEVDLSNRRVNNQAQVDPPKLSKVKKIYKIRDSKVDSVDLNSRNIELKANESMTILELAEQVKPYLSNVTWDNKVLSKEAVTLPENYIAKAKDNKVVTLRPVFKWKNPEFDHETNSFNGLLAVILEDIDNTTSSTTLEKPIKIEVFSSAKLVPVAFEIDHTNIPSQRIEISEQNPVDSIQLEVITEINSKGHKINIDVKPAVFINCAASIQGWGLQKTPVTIVMRGAAANDSIEVNLTSSQGTFSPSTVFISSSEAGKSYLQSEGLGVAEILVTSSRQEFKETKAEINFTFPLRFLGSALLGLAIGLIISYNSRKRKKESYSFWPLAGDLAIGIVLLTGYMVLGINLLGINLPEIPVFNEAAVFFIAAFGAGLPGLKSLLPKKQ